MRELNVRDLDYRMINEYLRKEGSEFLLKGCLGQRFIGAGMSGKFVTLDGVPGNALGAYLNGAVIDVHASAQDAVGDTMNDGKIIIRGNVGDAVGYAMRGGKIYIKGNAGYRAGIHMKAYEEKKPVMIIGGAAGSFLGEYQAGGVIIVLGLGVKRIVGNFPCTGMHGGKMFLRGLCEDVRFPAQVSTKQARGKELAELSSYLEDYCQTFDLDLQKLLQSPFTLVTPNSKNPYKQLYVAN